VEFIFSTPAESEAGTDADKLLLALNNKPMTQSEISRLFSGHKSREELTMLLTDLQALNRIKSTRQPGTKTVIWEKIN
jgi:DNA-binding transcriptional regulator GbsR (MarR family)